MRARRESRSSRCIGARSSRRAVLNLVDIISAHTHKLTRAGTPSFTSVAVHGEAGGWSILTRPPETWFRERIVLTREGVILFRRFSSKFI